MFTPAFIDLHVHLREPGQTAKGDIAHETAAAKAGGFGTIVAMANTTPPIDNVERWLAMQERFAQSAQVKVIQCACMTRERAGREPVDAAALKATGVIALSDDGSTPQDTGVMREVAYRAAEAGLLLIDHCEDPPSSRRGEIDFAMRDLELARETGARFHLQHLSAAEAVEALCDAQKDGLPVSGEATPHHLAFTAEAVTHWGTNAKMAPPLREERDRQALLAAVADGTLAAIATDHAPHTTEEKALPFDQAPNGIIGLEAAFPVCYKLLVKSGLMTLEDFLARLTTGPAKILGIELPSTQVELDLNTDNLLNINNFHSKSLNCPWDGYPGWGKVLRLGNSLS
ncbi:MAG: dihydroorotase [Victivallales bacterium]|nr:dihydroorotase [Victivallales bacterium]